MTTTCWDKSNGLTTEQPNAFACGPPNATTPFVSCCWHGDVCLSGKICNYTHPQTDGSGYYISGCTDPNYQDPSCPKHCADAWFPDIVYNERTSLWACCTTYQNNTKLCQFPTDETWQAPAPADLVVIGSIPASGQIFNTPTTTATSTGTTASTTVSTFPVVITMSSSSTTTPTSAASSQTSSGLSSGAQAGIGVGVAVGALLLIALGFLWYRRAAKNRRDTSPIGFGDQNGVTTLDTCGVPQPEQQTIQNRKEMAGLNTNMLSAEQRHELSTELPRYELNGV